MFAVRLQDAQEIHPIRGVGENVSGLGLGRYFESVRLFLIKMYNSHKISKKNILYIFFKNDLIYHNFRLSTLYHPSLQEGNKERLKKLFVFLLRHFDVVSRTPPTNESMKTLETLGIHIHSLLKVCLIWIFF